MTTKTELARGAGGLVGGHSVRRYRGECHLVCRADISCVAETVSARAAIGDSKLAA